MQDNEEEQVLVSEPTSSPQQITRVKEIRNPISRLILFLQRLSINFGFKFVVELISTYFGVKGMLTTCLSLGQLPYYQSLGVSGERYQAYRTVALTPWTIKSLLGTISDSIPILGYHKRYYIIFAALFGTLSFFILGVSFVPPALAAILFLFGNFEPAFIDLLCEGKYAELMVGKPQTGPDLVTLVWASYFVGSLVASAVVGPIADFVSPRIIFLICIPFAAQILVPTILGYLPEEKVSNNIKWNKLKENRKVFTLAILMTFGSIGLSICNLFGNQIVLFAYSITISFFLATCGFFLLPLELAKCNLYLFLSEVLYIQIPGALDYFYTAPPECLPNGPQFDFTYYITYSSIVQSIFGALGVTFFQSFMREWEFRPIFWCSTLLKTFASIVDIIIVKRWNVAIGIPDEFMYMIGFNIIYQVTYMLAFMPAVVLTSKLCPKSMETTVYAMLAGFQNFGQSVSMSLGNIVISGFGVKTEVPCNWDGLAGAIGVSHMVLPLICIPLTFILLPKAKMTDKIEINKKDVLSPTGPISKATKVTA
eukprot:c21763_g2_i1.p1 GENE.c21763_g2_i1~~c21763_g2_i1.p1  ORF type:complete len:538 (-),score=185.87 c21763_g2_i1:76-1689(-)